MTEGMTKRGNQMSKETKFYKIGPYELILNNIDMISEIMPSGSPGKPCYEVTMDGATIRRHMSVEHGNLIKERDDLVAAWKDCVK